MSMIETGEFNLTHPLTFDPFTFEQYNLPVHMGGFTLSDVGVVERVEALGLCDVETDVFKRIYALVNTKPKNVQVR